MSNIENDKKPFGNKYNETFKEGSEDEFLHIRMLQNGIRQSPIEEGHSTDKLVSK